MLVRRRRPLARRIDTLLTGAACLLTATTGLAQTSMAVSPPPAQEIRIEFVATSLRGDPITNLKETEIALVHGGALQEITAFAYDPARRVYQLRYRPPDGRAGAVGLRVGRAGTQVHGPDGGPLTPQWVTQAQDSESSLEDALAQVQPPTDVAFTQRTFRFGREPQGRHMTVAVALDPVATAREITLLTRVLGSGGRVACQQSNSGTVRAHEIATWSAHCHLPPGGYSAETAVRDATTNLFGVRREDLQVNAPDGHLDAGSLVLLSGASPMLPAEGEDNPLGLGGHLFIPSVRNEFAVGWDRLLFEATIIPAAESSPPTATLELLQDGRLMRSYPIQLPPPEESGEIVAFGSVPSGSWVAGSYELRIDVHQAAQEAVESATFVLGEGPVYRVGEPAGAAAPR